MVFGIIGGVIVSIIIIVGRISMRLLKKETQKKIKDMTTNLKIFVINGIH